MNALADPTEELARAVQETRNQETNLRGEIATCEERLSDARANVAMSATKIAELESLLAGYRRFNAFQSQRIVVFEKRIRVSRDEMRLIEDYESGAR